MFAFIQSSNYMEQIMDASLKEQFDQLAEKSRFVQITSLIEQIPESNWDWETILWYIRSLCNGWQPDRAIEVAMKYRKQGEGDPMWHYRLGIAFYRTGQYNEAELSLLQAKELSHDNAEITEWVLESLGIVVEERERKESKLTQAARRRAEKTPRDPNRQPFDGFDFSDFWDDCDYALKQYVGAPPSDEQFAEVESKLGYRLPNSYKWLMRQHNGGMPKHGSHPTEGRTTWSKDHIAISGIYGVDPSKSYSLHESTEDDAIFVDWGYPKIGVPLCDCPSGGHDMVFLDYRYCGPDGEPEVVHIDQEWDFEITYVADDFESFIRSLVSEESFEDDE